MNNGRPMTLGECARAEETDDFSPMTIPEMKLACIGFARDVTQANGLYTPEQVLKHAQEYFKWVIKQETT